MADHRSDAQALGFLPVRATRRAAAKPLAALALLFGLAAVPDPAAARKGKKRKDKKCKKSDDQERCPEACPGSCTICAERAEGMPLCGDGIASVVVPDEPCGSDNDCIGKTDNLGNLLPYCVTGVTSNGGPLNPLGSGACSRVPSPCA
jgi:hypothetical protein